MRRSLMTVAALLMVGVASSALAADAKPEDLLKARQGLFQSLKMQFGPLMGAVKADAPLPADAAARAANIVALAQVLPTAFGPGTETLPQSHAKADAFAKKAEFLEGFKTLGDSGTKLGAAIAAGQADGIKAAVMAVGKSCKGCHDNFKEE